MAKFELLVPFLIEHEAGVVPKLGESIESQFNRARTSGWADDPLDSGGETMIGVTMATYTTYCRRKGYPKPTAERLRGIPFKHWLDVAKSMYWDKWKADTIESQSLANILVDWVWASGVNGIKIPQQLLGVTADGIVGAKTLGALNKQDPKDFFDKIKERRIVFIDRIIENRPNQVRFEKGWKRRINSIIYEG